MEFMSNISGMDESKPSLFELLSESQLRDLLEPSLRYLLALATQRHPRYLIRILNRYDEVYALLMLLIERHYLRRWGGSFTENFYGLKRERDVSVKIPRATRFAPGLVANATKMRKSDIYKSLFVIVGIPYLKRKLDDAYENFAGGAAANLLGQGFRNDELAENATPKEKAAFWLKKFLRAVYPTVNAIFYFANLGFNLAYLFDKSPYHSPFDFLIGVRMRRLTEADHRAFEAAMKPSSTPSTNRRFTLSTLLQPSLLSRIILPKLLDSLKVLLPTSIFFLKFLEWWYASDFARQLSAKTAASIELPPPAALKPPMPGKDEQEDAFVGKDRRICKLPEDTGYCPICEREITNPTATQTGYVFCYPCVFRWVQDGGEEEVEERKGKCPVTGIRLLGGTEGLRRLMI
ncbi:Pex12 amino terminal region-domain-containing protein [Pyronema omphalodes]|nr:Pex12 amino terminal region-domain-containing protein [Pyronema omphalodes]